MICSRAEALSLGDLCWVVDVVVELGRVVGSEKIGRQELLFKPES